MKRSIFLNRLGLATGGALLLPSVSLLQSCTYQPIVRTELTKKDIELLDEIGETIIPTTTTSPGAKATDIGKYILLMYTDCMAAKEQAILLNGINELDARTVQSYSSSFIDAEANQKLEFLQLLQTEAEDYYLSMKGVEDVPIHYVHILKNLTISGYFSSKIGMTQAREYMPVPGKFEPCIPYSHGDKPWAT